MAGEVSQGRLRPASAFLGGSVIGVVGGLVGLGGAEFRLPLLMSVFGLPVLEAVIVNKAASLVVVASALPFRAGTVPLGEVAAHWPIIVNLLAGSLVGAWVGAGWATRLRSATLQQVIAVLLLGIAMLLLAGHGHGSGVPALDGTALILAGIVAGFLIGLVAALMGVAGGELLIPTLLLLYGVDIKLAGSLSLAVSLPTMVAAFARYSRDGSFAVLARERPFILLMALGSICGTFVGGLLLGMVPGTVLLPALAVILILSAWKIWRHAERPDLVPPFGTLGSPPDGRMPKTDP